MIQITPHIKIFLCPEPVDFRKGIDGLAGVCRKYLDKDPFSGSMFIFRNRRRTALKILLYDGQGFWLFMKRLSKGCFQWWPDVRTARKEADHSKSVLTVNGAELHLLLWNGDPSHARIGPEWRKINV
jgi:transposase